MYQVAFKATSRNSIAHMSTHDVNAIDACRGGKSILLCTSHRIGHLDACDDIQPFISIQ